MRLSQPEFKQVIKHATACFQPKSTNPEDGFRPEPARASDEFLLALCGHYFGNPPQPLAVTTMQDLAAAIGLGSAGQVRRLLQEAGKRNLIGLVFNTKGKGIDEKIKDKFALRNVFLCESANRGRDVRSSLGERAADHLERLLELYPNRKVALGGGRTLHAMLSVLDLKERPVTVSPMSLFSRGDRGSVKSGPLMDAPFLAMTLAWKAICGAHICAIPPLPAGKKEAQTFTENLFNLSTSLGSVFEHACNSDIFFTGASHLEETSHLVDLYARVGVPHQTMVKEGCIGHLNFSPVNDQGEDLSEVLLPPELKRKQRRYPEHCHPFLAAVGYKWLKQQAGNPKKTVVLVAGGPGKAPLVQGILKAGLVNDLITDKETATRLLETH